jgi:hypothetical protein
LQRPPRRRGQPIDARAGLRHQLPDFLKRVPNPLAQSRPLLLVYRNSQLAPHAFGQTNKTGDSHSRCHFATIIRLIARRRGTPI